MLTHKKKDAKHPGTIGRAIARPCWVTCAQGDSYVRYMFSNAEGDKSRKGRMYGGNVVKRSFGKARHVLELS